MDNVPDETKVFFNTVRILVYDNGVTQRISTGGIDIVIQRSDIYIQHVLLHSCCVLQPESTQLEPVKGRDVREHFA